MSSISREIGGPHLNSISREIGGPHLNSISREIGGPHLNSISREIGGPHLNSGKCFVFLTQTFVESYLGEAKSFLSR